MMTERAKDLDTIARDVRIHVFREAAATAHVHKRLTSVVHSGGRRQKFGPRCTNSPWRKC